MELNREGWAPTRFDDPNKLRQWASGEADNQVMVSGLADGTSNWIGRVYLSVSQTGHPTPEAAAIAIERARDAMLAGPALLKALKGLGVMPDGYCFCPESRDPKKPEQTHVGECVTARAAIAAASGGAR